MDPQHFRHRTGSHRTIAGIPIPTTRLAAGAAMMARTCLPEVLYHHTWRVFLFCSLLARQESISVASETLSVAAHFSCMGLSAEYASSQQRYELDSADCAASFLRQNQIGEDIHSIVWNAIAIHTTPGVPDRMDVTSRLLAHALRMDLFGEGISALTRSERAEIVDAFPRGERFARDYLEAVGRSMLHRPQSVHGTSGADILERLDERFQRSNHCGRILGARWDKDVG